MSEYATCLRCGVRTSAQTVTRYCIECAALTHQRTDAAWMADGACAEVGGDWWHPDKGGSARDAKRICLGDAERGIPECRVRERCLQWALDNNEWHGIWGGTTEQERRKLRRNEAA